MAFDAWGSSWGTPGASSWGHSWYRTAAVVTVDTHDGFEGGGKHARKKREQERLHNQLEAAFRSAFEKKPEVAQIIARNDGAIEPYMFPAYVEEKIDDDDEEAEMLLLNA